MWLGTVFCHPERNVSLSNKSAIKKNNLIIQVVQKSPSIIIIAYDQGKQKNVHDLTPQLKPGVSEL
jgi:hypothetical protein